MRIHNVISIYGPGPTGLGPTGPGPTGPGPTGPGSHPARVPARVPPDPGPESPPARGLTGAHYLTYYIKYSTLKMTYINKRYSYCFTNIE